MLNISIYDFASWRNCARDLLRQSAHPSDLVWQSESQSQQTMDLFASSANSAYVPLNMAPRAVSAATSPELRLPKAFLSLAKNVACFRDDGRWALLYSLAWRLLHEDRDLLADRGDPQVAKAFKMHKVVAREKHKMEAFVRFKAVKASDVGTDDEYFVAWFEPEHLIVPDKVDFFIRRFPNMSWSLLTPDCCAHWDQTNIQFSAGVWLPSDHTDNVEKLWLQYYKSIFNPARLKVKAMQTEMPKKYWRNMPEAALIPDLIRGATHSTEAMIEQRGGGANDKFVKAALVQQQRKLRRDR